MRAQLLPNPQASPGTETPRMPSAAATAQALEKGAPRDVPAGNQAPAIHLLVFVNLPCRSCSGQIGLGNFPMMLCVSESHRLIRHCTKAFPSGCLGFH